MALWTVDVDLDGGKRHEVVAPKFRMGQKRVVVAVCDHAVSAFKISFFKFRHVETPVRKSAVTMQVRFIGFAALRQQIFFHVFFSVPSGAFAFHNGEWSICGFPTFSASSHRLFPMHFGVFHRVFHSRADVFHSFFVEICRFARSAYVTILLFSLPVRNTFISCLDKKIAGKIAGIARDPILCPCPKPDAARRLNPLPKP